MNERMTHTIVEQARNCLEPTGADRDRMRKKVMGAVGASAVVTAGAAAAASSTGGASVGAPPAILTVVKLTLGGLVIGGAAVFTALTVAPNDPPAPKAVVEVVSHEPATPSPGISHAGDARKNAPADDPLPSVDERAAAMSSPPAAPSARSVPKDKKVRQDTESGASSESAPPNDDALLAELRLIRAATKALADSDADKAYALLEKYDRRFPNGVMRQERDGLAVSVLCNMGREKEARQAERRFKTQYPQAPLSIRVDESCRTFHVDNP